MLCRFFEGPAMQANDDKHAIQPEQAHPPPPSHLLRKEHISDAVFTDYREQGVPTSKPPLSRETKPIREQARPTRRHRWRPLGVTIAVTLFVCVTYHKATVVAEGGQLKPPSSRTWLYRALDNYHNEFSIWMAETIGPGVVLIIGAALIGLCLLWWIDRDMIRRQKESGADSE
jgi:hypothetical protein